MLFLISNYQENFLDVKTNPTFPVFFTSIDVSSAATSNEVATDTISIWPNVRPCHWPISKDFFPNVIPIIWYDPRWPKWSK
jgi:hypothetical protein